MLVFELFRAIRAEAQDRSLGLPCTRIGCALRSHSNPRRRLSRCHDTSIIRQWMPRTDRAKACYAILSPVLNRTSSLRRMQLLQQSAMMRHAPTRRHPRRYFPRSSKILVPLRTVSV